MKKENNYMKGNRRIYGAWFLIIFGLLIACKPTKKLEDRQQDVLDDALLWKVEVDGAAHPSYLFGTIHIIKSEDYFLPEGTLTAVDACEQMFFEIDMNEMSDMSALMGIMSKAFMSDNLTLKDLLSTEDYSLVEEHFQEMGLPIIFLERIKPMFLTVFAYGDMDPSGLQSGSMKSYEMEFFDLAKTKNMKTGGLETIDFQMSLFDSIDYKDQAGMLVDAIKNTSAGSDEFVKMTEIYKSQNVDAMVTMIAEESEGVDNFEDELLVKRNKNWIPQMIEEAGDKPTFFAVGAGHLGGKNGVIRLLRAKGVKVEAVKP